MSDIVERLRAAALDKDNFPRMRTERAATAADALEAAAEIERLRAALEEIASLGSQKRGSVSYAMAAIARAALEAPQGRIDTAQPAEGDAP
ncbi:MAG: hypothetical protein RLZZ09_1103 [Pseudomonadota bacterium]|jgi:hypothetical protein